MNTPLTKHPMNCREAGPGRGLCYECANGHYERCLYVAEALTSNLESIERLARESGDWRAAFGQLKAIYSQSEIRQPCSNLVTFLRNAATTLDTAESLPEAFLPQRLRQAADEIERLRAALHTIAYLKQSTGYAVDAQAVARQALSGDSSAPETSAPQPIAWVVIAENGGICSSGTYAPGLPEGTHDLYYWGERRPDGTGDGPRFGSATEALLQQQRAKCAIEKTCLEYPRCRCGANSPVETPEKLPPLCAVCDQIEALHPKSHAFRAKAATKPPECTCTPAKVEQGENWGSITAGFLDPNCPVHWRQTLVQKATKDWTLAECSKHGRMYATWAGCSMCNAENGTAKP